MKNILKLLFGVFVGGIVSYAITMFLLPFAYTVFFKSGSPFFHHLFYFLLLWRHIVVLIGMFAGFAIVFFTSKKEPEKLEQNEELEEPEEKGDLPVESSNSSIQLVMVIVVGIFFFLLMFL